MRSYVARRTQTRRNASEIEHARRHCPLSYLDLACLARPHGLAASLFSRTRESSQNGAVTAKIGARKSYKVDEVEGDPILLLQVRAAHSTCSTSREEKSNNRSGGTCGHGAEAVTRDKPDVTSVGLGFAAPPAEVRQLYAIAPDCGSQSLAFARCLTSDSLKSLLNGQGFPGHLKEGHKS
jgi:hypothetical protein